MENKATEGQQKQKPSKKSTSPPRAYTEYNIFFQIEREYILQNLGVIPSLKPGDIFSSSDGNYEGPELPPRYANVILPSDWYIPGKGRRKKRRHRASHGKISFTDLSKTISTRWKGIDDETKLFCAQLSDIGMQKYKREMQRIKNLSQKQPQLESGKDESKDQKKAAVMDQKRPAAMEQKKPAKAQKKPAAKKRAGHSTLPNSAHEYYTNTAPAKGAAIDESRINPDFATSRYANPPLSTQALGKPFHVASANPLASMQHPTKPLDTSTCGFCTTKAGIPQPKKTSESTTHDDVDMDDDDILHMYMKSGGK